MSEKQQFLDAWGRECPTTLKLLKAYPAAKADLKPHERCRSAKELAWTFVFEGVGGAQARSEEHTSELQSRLHLVCRLLLEKKKVHGMVPHSQLCDVRAWRG